MKRNDQRWLSAVGDETLRSNVVRRLSFAGVQLDHAKNVHGRARSGYYQAACMYLASVVEALLHVLLEKARRKGTPFPPQKRYQEHTQLPQKFFGKDVFACRQSTMPMNITKNTDMQDAIDCCRAMKLLSPSLARRCHTVRIVRNQIHIFGRGKNELCNTRKDIDRIGSVIDALARHLVQ